MIIGGAFRGMKRASRQSFEYVRSYCLAGLPMVIAIGLLWGDSQYGNLTVAFLIAHYFFVIIVWPAALFANFAALRLFRPRSWRGEPWRGWVAGILGVACCWGGIILWPKVEEISPPQFRQAGGELGMLYGIGVLVFLSNIAVLLTWLLPPWKPSRLGE